MKADDTITVFDVETADSRHTRICQIGLVKLANDGKLSQISSTCLMIDPEIEFGYYNTQTHGICADDVRWAPNFEQAWEETIQSYFDENTKVVGHNLKFDLSAMDKCCDAYGLVFPELKTLDTMDLAKDTRPNEQSFTLDAVAGWFGHDLSEAAHHDALNDAIATAAAFRGFYPKGARFAQWKDYAPKLCSQPHLPQTQQTQSRIRVVQDLLLDPDQVLGASKQAPWE